MTLTMLGPGQPRDFLRALQMHLARIPEARPAFKALRAVLDTPGPVDWDRETDGLLDRLAEVERVRPATAGRIPLSESADIPERVRERHEQAPELSAGE